MRHDMLQTDFLAERQQSRLENGVDELNRLLKIVKKQFPDAQFYLDGSETLYIINGSPHDEDGRPRQDRILGSARLRFSGGGDW